MKRKTTVAVSLILILAIFCSFTSYAADAQIQGSAQIASTHAVAAWSNTTPGRMCVAYEITASRRMDTLGATKVEIYRYLHGQWEIEETFYWMDYPDMQDSNEYVCMVSIEYSTEYLEIPYYAIVYFYAESATMISTVTQKTNVI